MFMVMSEMDMEAFKMSELSPLGREHKRSWRLTAGGSSCLLAVKLGILPSTIVGSLPSCVNVSTSIDI